MAKKTENLGLPITDDPNLRFAEWWRLINGDLTLENKPSAFQIIDKKVGEIDKNVEVKEHIVGEWQGEVVPNNGYVEKVYLNSNIETIDFANQLYNTLKVEGEDLNYVLAFTESNKIIGIMQIANFDIPCIAVVYQDLTSEENTVLFVGFTQEDENLELWKEAFIQNYGGYGIIHEQYQINSNLLPTFEDEDGTVVEFGLKNSMLSTLLSITPFTQEIGQQGGLYVKDNIAVAANVDANEELEKMQNLQIGNQVFKMGDSEYTNSVPTTAALGGIPKGTTFDKMTIQQVLNMLLYPYVAFNFSLSLSTNGGVYEIGTSVTVTSATVNITLGSVGIEKIEVYSGSNLIGSKTEDIVAGTNSISISETISTDKSLTAKVTDESGVEKTQNSNAFKFVYPYYYGVAEDGEAITEDLIKSLTKDVATKGNKTYTFNMAQQVSVFAYPSNYGAISKIFDENSFDVTDTFEKNTLTINGITYFVYVLRVMATSTMKYTFNY